MNLTRALSGAEPALDPLETREYKPDHEHDEAVTSVGITIRGDLQLEKLNGWLSQLLREQGQDIFRMKGVLSVRGLDKRYVFQGVHMLFDGRPDRPWENEMRQKQDDLHRAQSRSGCAGKRLPRVSRIVRQRKRKSRQAKPALKAKWRTNIDDHPIGLAWSPDGRTLAVAGVSGPITLFNAADGLVQHKLPGHAFDTMAISWHKDSRLLASVGQDGKVRLWDAETGAQRSEMAGGASWVERVAFSPLGDRLVSAAGRKLRLWNSCGELIREYPDANSTITDIKWRYDGRQFAISAYNGAVLYDPAEAEPLRRFRMAGFDADLGMEPRWQIHRHWRPGFDRAFLDNRNRE